MDKKDNKINNVSPQDLELLEIIKSSYLTLDDVKWLKSRRWFKRFLKIYAKELKKRHNKTLTKKRKVKTNKEDIEVLDFTQSIKMPSKEVIEILDFTRTIDITDVKNITRATKKAKKKLKREKMFWSVTTCVCLISFIILMVILVNWYLENKMTDDVTKKINKAAELKEIKTTTKNEIIITTKSKVITDYEKYANMDMLSVNFDNLKSINSDTVGWLKVPGTKINYPFVHTDNNEYYLKHSFDKRSNKKGWVYLDFRNNIDNLSKNNIIYAHGLVNNEMFGSMRKVIKKSWYTNKANHIIKVVTPSSNQLWQVFSTYTIEPETYYITTNFTNDEEFTNFINTIKSRSVYDFGALVTPNDKILTLSSCYDDEKRMVLHAKLLEN